MGDLVGTVPIPQVGDIVWVDRMPGLGQTGAEYVVEKKYENGQYLVSRFSNDGRPVRRSIGFRNITAVIQMNKVRRFAHPPLLIYPSNVRGT